MAFFRVGPVRAHDGDDDHGDVVALANPVPDASGLRTAFGQTELFELLLKYAPPEGGRASLLVFLSDVETNEPVAGARVELELATPSPRKAIAEPTGTDGIYRATLDAVSGKVPLIATVQAGDRVDLIAIQEVDLGPAAAEPGARAKGAVGDFPWVAVGGAGALALALVAATFVVRRRRAARRGASSAAALALAFVLGVARAASGHGGEDHGAPVAATQAAPPATGTVHFPKESQFLLGIRTLVVREREVEARVEAFGKVVPRADGHAQIFAPQPGRIAAVGGHLPLLGDRVRRGQPLAIVEQSLGAAESGQLQAEAIRARAAVAHARAQRDQRQRDLARLRALGGVVAHKDVEQAELALALAEEELARAEREAALFTKGGLGRRVLTSPIDGTVAEVDVSVGEQVSPDRPLFTIIDTTTLWVEAEVFEADLPRLERARAAAIRVEGYDTIFEGTLFRLGQIVSPGTRTVKAIFTVPNPNGRLRVGMFATVSIAAGERSWALVVPDSAVVEEGGRRFVFVKIGPEEFVRREVLLGPRDGPFWAVRSGLEKGERVVIAGTYPLRTTMR